MIPGSDFWEDEQEELYKILFPVIKDAAVTGLGEAAASIAIDWGIGNAAAAAWAEAYTFGLVKGITGTSEALLQDKVSSWLGSSHRKIDDLMESLTPMFGEFRAEMIAVTEVTRAIFEGSMAGWETNPYVTGKRWMSSEDELVCEICGPLAASPPVGIHDDFDGGFAGPPGHVNCRCWVEPVLLGQEVLEAQQFVDVDPAGMIAHYKDSLSGLSSEEENAIRRYLGGSFRGINDRLRGSREWDQNFISMRENLLSAMKKAPGLPGDVNLYREANYMSLWNAAKSGALSPGDMYVDKAFSSTSIFSRYAEARATRPEGTILFRIKAHKGSEGMFFGDKGFNPRHYAEGEVLLPPSAEMKIINFFFSDNSLVMELEYK